MSVVLITGGSGFIGGRLCRHLMYEGYKVINYDLSDTLRANIHVHGDIMDLGRLRSTIDYYKADYVFHLAGVSNTGECITDPYRAMEINCGGTINVLQSCVDSRHTVKRVFLAGSSLVSSVMGLNLAENGTIIDDPRHVDLDCYGHVYTTTKIFLEMIAKNYFMMHELPFTILRFGICYGPAMTPGVLVHNFLDNVLLKKEPMYIHGDGRQQRYYMHVKDLVNGCVMSMVPQAENKTFYLIPKWITTVNDIAYEIQCQIGGEIKHVEKRSHDFHINKAFPENDFGWEADIGLKEGIEDTINWYKGCYGL